VTLDLMYKVIEMIPLESDTWK